MRELANVNYQKELEKLIEQHEKEGKVPRLFLHACCAPCSSYVLEYLSRFFSVTVFFYNPNISPKEEYEKRVAEIRRLISEMEFLHPVDLVEGAYRPEDFYAMAKGWRMYRREENGVSNVIGFEWRQQQSWLRRADMIILPPHFPSVL